MGILTNLFSKQQSNPNYPLLKLYDDGKVKLVVVFTGPKKGILLYSSDGLDYRSYLETENWAESQFRLLSPEEVLVLRNDGKNC